MHLNKLIARRLLSRVTRCQLSTMSASSPTPSTAKSKVLIITGPTAVGKTNVSLDLAEKLGGEIISADSVQVYKGLDIGSDKIPIVSRRGIPHHLIDILEPEDEFSAGDFYTKAREATEDILSRGKIPIVVGGTGFYLKWYMYGKPSTASSTKESEAAAQARLDQAWKVAEEGVGRELTAEEKWEAGVKVIEELGDIDTAARVRKEYQNYYRLHRVIDILLQSGGKPLSDLNLDENKPLDYDFRPYFLFRPREELYRRIDGRVEEMVALGLLTECNWLSERGLEPNSNCATKAIGYRQAMEFLQKYKNTLQLPLDGKNINDGKNNGGSGGGTTTTTKPTSNSTSSNQAAAPVVTEDAVINLVKDIQAVSRQFCRRQFNWFRENSTFLWIDAAREQEEILNDIVTAWNTPLHQGACAVGKGGRLDKEEAKAMKYYIAKLQRFVKGKEAVKGVMEEIEKLLVAAKE